MVIRDGHWCNPFERAVRGACERYTRRVTPWPGGPVAVAHDASDTLYELEHAFGLCRWAYLPNATFEIALRCDLSPAELNWTIPHELLEALLAPYAAFVENNWLDKIDRNKALRDLLDDQHGDIRNTIIEHLLCVIIGTDRPARLVHHAVQLPSDQHAE